MSRTYEALLQAEAKHRSRHLENHDYLDIEQKLLQLNLSKEHLVNQNLSELVQSLNAINTCIAEPSTALDINSDDSFLSRQDILPVFLKRKRLVLELIDTAVTDKSIKSIHSVLSHIQNKNIRNRIEKPLSMLNRKNEILKKEYQSLAVVETECAIAAAESEKTVDAPSVSHTQSSNHEKKTRTEPKSLLGHGSLSILIIGSLLAIWGVAITFTYFLKIPSSIIQEYAFFVTLGFLFGILFRRPQT